MVHKKVVKKVVFTHPKFVHILFYLFRYLDNTTIFTLMKTNTTIRYILISYAKNKNIYLKSDKCLYSYQKDALIWMRKCEEKTRYGIRGGLLQLQMGLGKTLISLMHCLQTYEPGKPTLIVASSSIILTWRMMINKFFTGVKCLCFHKDYVPQKVLNNLTMEDFKKQHFVIVTYSFLAARSYPYIQRLIMYSTNKRREMGIVLADKPFITQKEFRKGHALFFCMEWERIITDESTEFVNNKTDVFRALMGICAKKRWCLTGTPIRNKDTDMFNLLKFLGYTGVLNANQFSIGIFKEHKLHKRILLLNYENVGIVLPEKKVVDVTLELSEKEKMCYEFFLTHARGAFTKWTIGKTEYSNVLSTLTRLRQCSVAPYLLCSDSKRNGTSHRQVNKEIEAFKTICKGMEDWIINKNSHAGIKSTKIRKATRLIREFSNDKFVVFAEYLAALDLLKYSLKLKGIKSVTIDGSICIKEREKNINIFENDSDVQVLLITSKTGSEGLNLTCANKIIILQGWWCPVIEDQEIGRIWRIGQTKPVTIYRLIIKDSIDVKIIKHAERKREISKRFSQEVKSNQSLDKNNIKSILMDD